MMTEPLKFSTNQNSLSNSAVDGLFAGLLGGVAMLLGLAAVVFLSSNVQGGLLERFSSNDQLTSPLQGLFNHLAVSSIYGVLFGVLVWPVLRRFATLPLIGWVGGALFGLLLFLISKTALLAGTDSPLEQLPLWGWAFGHIIYGLVLGGQFTRKAARENE